MSRVGLEGSMASIKGLKNLNGKLISNTDALQILADKYLLSEKFVCVAGMPYFKSMAYLHLGK
jgi:hypothetical protein